MQYFIFVDREIEGSKSVCEIFDLSTSDNSKSQSYVPFTNYITEYMKFLALKAALKDTTHRLYHLHQNSRVLLELDTLMGKYGTCLNCWFMHYDRIPKIGLSK